MVAKSNKQGEFEIGQKGYKSQSNN